MAQIETVAIICTSYTAEQKTHFVFCLTVTCLICCGGCLWCCPLPDTFKASVFLPSLDFHHLHLLRDCEADGALCFQDTNTIVSLSAEISRAAVNCLECSARSKLSQRRPQGVMMHVRIQVFSMRRSAR